MCLRQKHRAIYRAAVLTGYLLRQVVPAVHLLAFAMFLCFLIYSRILVSKEKKALLDINVIRDLLSD